MCHKIKSVGIIGCGWLGSVLAKNLIAQHVNVIATTTTFNKIKSLANLGIKAELLVLPENEQALENHIIFQQQQLVIAITPQLKYGKKDYAKKIENIIKVAEKTTVEKVILISTTGVYRGLTGKITEETKLMLKNTNVAALAAGEQVVLASSLNSTIIRFAGLVGEDRHPGRFLAGKKQLSNANEQVNLIHQQDAINMLIALLENDDVTGIFNGLSDTQATRKSFYQQAAKKLQLTPPEFTDNDKVSPSAYKYICAKKIQDKLSIKLVYPDLMLWLNTT